MFLPIQIFVLDRI